MKWNMMHHKIKSSTYIKINFLSIGNFGRHQSWHKGSNDQQQCISIFSCQWSYIWKCIVIYYTLCISYLIYNWFGILLKVWLTYALVLFLLHHPVGRRGKKHYKCMMIFLLKGVKSSQGSVSRVKPVLSESDVITLPSSPGSSALST